ncbi:MAG TPA: peptidylprolyl isomerase [Planctomycetota bacterium]|jgi:cyclophilin family peptidyl-prolyl cis-trans isomerase|nr:peptidylprolyl isomerase [Planctomycetota bacterium]
MHALSLLAVSLLPLSQENAPMPQPAAPAARTADPAIEAVRKDIADKVAAKKIDKSAKDWRTKLPMPPEIPFTKDVKYFWNLETNKGNLKIRFMTDVAPKHVASFLYLTELGYFEGLTFHRVMAGFMAQGGCPLGNGRGSPGYRLGLELKPGVGHGKAGILSMANSGPGTDGSQFFLTFKARSELDGSYTVFGEVEGEEGMKTLQALEAAADPRADNGVPPKERLEIKRAFVTTG